MRQRLLVPVIAVLVLCLVVLVTFLALGRETGRTTADAADRPCAPSASRPGPLLDLGVQAGTGDPRRPVLPETEVDTLVDRAVGAGADVISTVVSWQSVLPTADSRPSFTALDRVVEAARQRGLEVRVRLTGSPAWAVADSEQQWQPPTSRVQLQRWRAFVALVLRHLDGAAAYVEVWSEPDEDRYWAGRPDPAEFARLLRATDPVVRRHAPDAVLVSGGLGGNDLGYLDQLYNVLGEDRPFDLVGVHPFAGALPPLSRPASATYEGPFGDYDGSFLGYRTMRAVMATHGDADRGLYLGEFGYSTEARGGQIPTPDELRATYATQALNLVTCTPYVVGLSWYYLHPTPYDDPSWTLLDEQGRPNETYDALAAWSRTRP